MDLLYIFSYPTHNLILPYVRAYVRGKDMLEHVTPNISQKQQISRSGSDANESCKHSRDIETQRLHKMKPSPSPLLLVFVLFLFALDNKCGCLSSLHFADALLFAPPVSRSHCSRNKWRGGSACGGVVSVKKRYGVLQMSVQPVSFLQSCF